MEKIKEKSTKKTINKKSKNILIIIFTLIFGLICFFGGFFIRKFYTNDAKSTFSWVYDLIDEYGCYFDENGNLIEFTTEDYMNAIKDGLLDKYSDYYSKENYEKILLEDEGYQENSGLSFYKYSDDTVIFDVCLNSPAYRAGVKKGDEIKAVYFNNVKTAISTRAELFSVLPSIPINTEFSIFVKRKDSENELSFTIKKEAYVESFVLYSDNEVTGEFIGSDNKMPEFNVKNGALIQGLGENGCYILLSSFSGNADKEIKDVFKYIKEHDKTSVILDLRGNGGGQMSILKNIASYFIKDNSGKDGVVAITVGKDDKKTYFYANGDNFNDKIIKVVVIADEFTASASECLIGAMLYYKNSFSIDNLLIVNKNYSVNATTFGKGIMQTTYKNYVMGNALKLTTAKVYQPDGVTCIHGVGIKAKEENSFTSGDLALKKAIELIA